MQVMSSDFGSSYWITLNRIFILFYILQARVRPWIAKPIDMNLPNTRTYGCYISLATVLWISRSFSFTKGVIRHGVAKVNLCQEELINDRKLLAEPIKTLSKVECAALCSRDNECGLAVWIVTLDVGTLCRKYSVSGEHLGVSWLFTENMIKL